MDTVIQKLKKHIKMVVKDNLQNNRSVGACNDFVEEVFYILNDNLDTSNQKSFRNSFADITEKGVFNSQNGSIYGLIGVKNIQALYCDNADTVEAIIKDTTCHDVMVKLFKAFDVIASLIVKEIVSQKNYILEGVY